MQSDGLAQQELVQADGISALFEPCDVQQEQMVEPLRRGEVAERRHRNDVHQPTLAAPCPDTHYFVRRCRGGTCRRRLRSSAAGAIPGVAEPSFIELAR